MFARFAISTFALVFAVVTGISARAEVTLFPDGAFGVAGPIPTPVNITDLVGPTAPGTSVTFDPGDLGFLRFDGNITDPGNNVPNLGILFNIISAVPSATNDLYISVLLGNIAPTGGGGLTFTRSVTAGFQTPNGNPSIFQFTQVPGTGTFNVNTDAFVDACGAIGGCNSIVVGTSGLGAAGGGSFLDGGTLTFSSVVAASPEPGVWLLMILGFVGVALRAKADRRHRQGAHARFDRAATYYHGLLSDA